MTERPPYKLREDLIIKRRVFAGEVKYVVKDPLRMEYFTLAPLAYDLLSLCDGRRDLDTLLALARKRFPKMKLDADTLANFYETFKKLHYLEDAWNRNILLIEKQRKSRQKKKAINPSEIHLAAWDADRFLDRIVKPLGFLFTRWAMVVYVLLTVAAFGISFTHADEFALSFTELWVIPGTPFLGLVVLWAALLGTVLLHELGHGLTCKHYGGEVHKIGFMLLYFNPCFFCDVSESLFFEKKSQKQAVTAAGGIVNLVTASLATFVWFFLARDLWIGQVAHRVALYSGLTTVIFNLNPLSRYDGYFLLSQHLEMPNLQQNAFHFLGQRIRKLLRLPLDNKTVTPRERRIYWIYGTLSAIYLAFAMTFIYLAVAHWVVDRYRALGYVIAGFLLYKMSGRYRKSLFRFLRFAALDKAAHFKRHRVPYGVAGVALLLAVLLLPMPRHVSGDFTLRAGREVVMRAPEAGVVSTVFAGEGSVVRRGMPVFEIRQDSIGLERVRATALREGAEAGGAAALMAGDAAAAALHDADARAGRALERYGETREGRLRPTVPFDAVVLTPRLSERVGSFYAQGDTICEVADLDTMHAEVLLDELVLGILDPDGRVELVTRSHPWRTARGRVLLVSSQPDGGEVRRQYRVLVEVTGHGGSLRPGTTGRARLRATPASPLEQVGGWLARILRVEFWL